MVLTLNPRAGVEKEASSFVPSPFFISQALLKFLLPSAQWPRVYHLISSLSLEKGHAL